ncbi:Aste57867_10591 [Aphanomyces stellatus]|uniref:3'-phosphate/5'-hydroxy nucleic acid ligase n=1 Tax=Aphanomyces stellatus TaxID=120398 RepID=A0A485KR78_9STRA|nr:hypothetical protein As57867_010551 [Aphanomyces stellatus]VFT87463.1 Aste57867_10591 [Aphanomyces stellatus]
MFIVGDHDARVFLDKDHLDRETIKQIESIAAHPSVAHVRIMPDAHKGNGCCVGFTCKLTTTILPGLIGGDIGCGIALHPLPASLLGKKNSLAKLDKAIQRNVPMGNGHDCLHPTPLVQPAQYAKYFADAQAQAAAFAAAYTATFGDDSVAAAMPTYNMDWFQALCRRIGSTMDVDLRAMGTLGGGNHFVEVNQGPDDTGFLTVHTGSRNLGQRIARYHHCKTTCEPEANDVAAGDDDDADLRGVDPASHALRGADAALYFYDMIWAQTYACMNRRAILSVVLDAFGLALDTDTIIESVHNYIDFRDLVVRKGAIRCHANERCVVALNMRDGVLVCQGLGNTEWNMSGPHGCGRIQSRGRAKAKKSAKGVDVAMRKFRDEMGDVYSTCVVPETLDERPSVYRDAAIIQAALGETATIVLHAKTLLNVKGF